MKPICELNEVIWEICSKCNNNCSYCGSKDSFTDGKINEDIIYTIADELSCYSHHLDINISGGDPLLVSYDTHKKIKELLSPYHTLKIIVNPKSFETCLDYKSILSLYDWIGISINTKEELDLFNKYQSDFLENITIITNFNILTLWNYKQIEEMVYSKRLNWQIQYTMYPNFNELSIYDKKGPRDILFQYIKESFDKKVKLVLADNLNNGECSAGKNSIGILSNGDIVPCLSMRSWDTDLNRKGCYLFGNISQNTLKNIWIHKFAGWRCDKQTCCKDICNAPYVINQPIYIPTVEPIITGEKDWTRTVMLYGTFVDPNDYYRKSISPNVIAYAVNTGESYMNNGYYK